MKHLLRTFPMTRPPLRCLLLTGTLINLACFFAPVAFSEEKLPSPRVRVAFGPFSTDDGFQRSRIAVMKFTSLLEPRLQAMSEVEWVERQEIDRGAGELGLGVSGILDGKSAVRLGRWAKADILLLGNFHRVGEKREEKRIVLTIEAVDLARADVLFAREIPVEGDPRDPVVVRSQEVEAAVQASQAVVKEAVALLHSERKSTVIAPLFFRNVDPSPRLGSLEDQLFEAFQKLGAGRSDLRLVRFPRAIASLGESELALLGLTDADPNAWLKVADSYVWGEYHELKSDGAEFSKVPVKMTLYIWNGEGAPKEIVQQGTVGELKSVLERLVQLSFEAALQHPPRGRTPKAREEIASSLKARVTEIRKTIGSFGSKQEKFLETEEGKSLSLALLGMLEAACFFSPQDGQLQWDRLQTRWGSGREPRSFFEQWQKTNEVADYNSKFSGSGSVSNPRLEDLAVMLDQLAKHQGIPMDALPVEIGGWQATFQERYAKAVLDAHDWKKIGESLRVLDDPDLRQKVIKTLWTDLCRDSSDPGQISLASSMVYELEPKIRKFYEEIGKPQEAGAFFALFKSRQGKIEGPASSTATRDTTVIITNLNVKTPVPAAIRPPAQSAPKTVPSPPAPSNPISSLPQFHPIVRNIPLSKTPFVYEYDCFAVDSLLTTKSGVWMGLIQWGRAETSDQMIEKSRLGCYNPSSDSCTWVSETLGPHSQINSIVEADGLLWLALEFDGVWNLHPYSRQITKFGVKEGLLTPNMFHSAVTKDKIYFGGTREGKRLLNVFDRHSKTWGRMDVTPAPSSKKEEKPSPTTRLKLPASMQWICPQGPWLLIGSDPWILIDVRTAQARTLREVMRVPSIATPPKEEESLISRFFGGEKSKPQTSPKIFSVNVCCAGDKGYWLGTSDGLRFLDPDTGKMEAWSCPAGAISNLMVDGEYLWIISAPVSDFRPKKESFYWSNRQVILKKFQEATTHCLVFHRPTRKWVGAFSVPGVASQIAASQSFLYLGFQFGTVGVVEIDKRPILSTPKEKWVSVGK